jgi:hypothetical protein
MRYPSIGFAVFLAACSSTPSVQGNERGGMIPWFATNEAAVFKAATEHCAKYGKSARITSIKAEAGGHALFDCA